MTTRRTVLAGLGLLAMPAIARPARAATRLTVASLLGRDKPETLIWRHVAEKVEAALPGAFAFNIVPNAALGAEREVAEGLRLGSIQASLLTVASLSAWAPDTQILDLPFLFRDPAHLKRVVSGDLGTVIKARLAAERFAVPAFVNYGARNLIAKAPMLRPEAVRGHRIRVLQSPVHAALWQAFGAYPTAIPIPETYNALQNGVVDMMDFTKSAYAGFRLYEVVPVTTETRHIWASGVAAFSAPFWDGLEAEKRAALAAAVTEGATYFDDLVETDAAAAMRKAQEAGGSLVQPEDLGEWQRIGRSVWPAFAGAVGGLDRIEAIAAA
ncbi:ABC transporter substrate-binding protein [Aureimonas endophytica]|uniref:ABC transporter substrate-binding protein n=1 Tax=Aureimonas endophytica TaxID=2027858 RepID=A0A916ZUY6_9HYPH|nr:TRAP transporter substrate-binding protein [Aureimonas endophytica]GGE15383.1 ABC transporter substrate-binding protein [Aureimonas endophytica]